MNNKTLAQQLHLFSDLIILHNGDPFKSKSLSSLARQIELFQKNISDLSENEIKAIRGVGKSSYHVLRQLIDNGISDDLEQYFENTPVGIIQLMKIKGLGTKTIAKLWHDYAIESPEQLLEKCQSNDLQTWKGFGEKKEKDIKKNILFYLENKGKLLYRDAVIVSENMIENFKNCFNNNEIIVVGEVSRKMPIISTLSFLTEKKLQEKDIKTIEKYFSLKYQYKEGSMYRFLHVEILCCIDFYFSPLEHFEEKKFFLQSSELFQKSINNSLDYSTIDTTLLTPARRESDIEQCQKTFLYEPIKLHDIKGLIHCHSIWSDGKNSIEEMARSCIERGFEYMMISDHSKSAFYANGLNEKRVYQQHKEIDILNQQLSPFKIFKSIEADILYNGSLDYDDDILSTFDIVIGSIHSQLEMTKEKATERLLQATKNPHLTILGHPTGRLLTLRKGYEIDYHSIIQSCIDNNVIIEINANPYRLDFDWSYVTQAIQKGCLMSINPDSHSKEGIDDLKYGIAVAEKTILRHKTNFSSWPLEQVEQFICSHKNK